MVKHKIRIMTDGPCTEIYVDDVKLNTVTSIEIEYSPGAIPRLRLEMYAPDVKIDADTMEVRCGRHRT